MTILQYTSGTTTCTFASPLTVGSTVVLIFCESNTTAVATGVTDNGGNSYAADASYANTSVFGSFFLWRAPVTIAATVLTPTVSGGSVVMVYAWELSGSMALDDSAGAESAFGTAVTSGTLDPTVTGAIAVGVLMNAAAGNIVLTATNGWSIDSTANAERYAISHTLGAPGAYTFTGTTASSTIVAGLVAAYRAVALAEVEWHPMERQTRPITITVW